MFVISVKYNDWNIWYEKILEDFAFRQSDDEESAQLLNNILTQKQYYNINEKDFPDKAIIFGAGPSIKRHINIFKNNYDPENYLIIASDGANTALLEEDIIADIIVTDLDGNIEDLIKANHEKSILFLHAHGDNKKQIQTITPHLTRIIPTTQSEPHGILENYGGFTDGDRALHIAVYKLKMKEIILAGMDFGKITTKYSRPNQEKDVQEADEFKKKKLSYAERLTDALIKNNPHIKFVKL
ncbi:MAG: 6-hydroxymethyl-7,8-dihydropterin pyrophosphokinase [Methanosphaera sp. rholeuAM74]|nr:MAG: 6-hydroxymethyl-7,8-dihydropterin pyrophosphokinase [Methanosphaera sp. rholeuAM74]